MRSELKVLIIDTDVSMLNQLNGWLTRSGYVVFTTADAQEGIQIAIKEAPSIILLDLQQGKMDGIEIVSSLRDDHFLFHPTIVVMAEQSENFIQVAAYNAGADDFVVKPFSKHWFDGKLKAWTRRFAGGGTTMQMNNGLEGLQVDPDNYAVTLWSKQYMLSHREFDILNLLLSRPRKVFTREEIKSGVWRTREKVRERTIDVHIHKLREKLGSRHIKTVKGVGYRFDM